MELKISTDAIIEAYNDGQSMTSIARAFGTYPMTIQRILMKNGVELRHDTRRKGELYVKNGEKLIEWAKAQGRLVTKEELAKVIGKKRLSPSYFIKYPELGRYIEAKEQKDILYYSSTLYAWLKQNGILFKPNDKKALGAYVDVLLLGEYEGFAIQLNIKPKNISKKAHAERMQRIYEKSKDTDITVFFIDEKYFEEDLIVLKLQLDDYKSLKGK